MRAKHTHEMLDHIFGDRKEEFINFLIKFRNGEKQLPILNIWSEEQGTGKSVFLYWLKHFIDSSTIVGRFYLDSIYCPWARKKMLLIEDVFKKDIESLLRIRGAVTIQANNKCAIPATIDANFTLVVTSSFEYPKSSFLNFEVKPLKKMDTDFCIKLNREEFAFEEYLQAYEKIKC